MSELEIVERQNAIIRIQHISAADADALPVVARMNQAAEIRREIE